MNKHIKKSDTITLTSKALHDIRNSLNTIVGYSQMLQEDEFNLEEQTRMHTSIENAASNIQSLLVRKKEKLLKSDFDETKNKLKVLIVDDNEDNRVILELLLKKYPLQIFHAHNGLDSVKVATTEKPTLIFMDLHMPGINGIEASRLIKDKLPDVAIIALSGDSNAIEEKVIESDIFESHILKPFHRDEIRKIVTKFTTLQPKSFHANNLQTTQDNPTSKFIAQKILIVDDRPQNLTLFQDILTPYNYEIKVATNGEDALKLANDFHPELILLDVVMPQMDGFEVLHQLKLNKSTNEIPVIFLTANDTTDDIVNGFEAGVVDYIAKPFHPRELIARVDTHLKKAKLLANIKRLMEHSFHELYTPLTVISSAMQMQELEYKQTDYTQMTLAASKTLQNIYDELYYSINYTDSLKYKTKFDFTALLLQRISYFTLIARSRSLKFKTELVDQMPVECSQEEIERVIDNLLSNALKYTQEHKEISISLKNENGIGKFSICNPVSKRVNVEKIFQKYYRDEEEMFGLGLGLELVQAICKKNSIHIRATSDNNLFCIEMELQER